MSQDDDFTLVVQSRSVEREGLQVTGKLPAGSSFTITEESSQTTSISSSVGLEAGFFDIFSASVSLEVSSSYTASSGTSVTIFVDCESGQSGQIFWYPLYDVYSGFFTPSNTNAEYAIPQDSQASKTNYRVKCFG